MSHAVEQLSASNLTALKATLANGGSSYLLCEVENAGQAYAIRIEPQAYRILTLDTGALRCPNGLARDKTTLRQQAEALGLTGNREVDLLLHGVPAVAAAAYQAVHNIASGGAMTSEPPAWVHPDLVAERKRVHGLKVETTTSNPVNRVRLSLDGLASIEGDVSEDAGSKVIGRNGAGYPSILLAKLSPDTALRIERGGFAVWIKSRNADHWFCTNTNGVLMSNHQSPVNALAALRTALKSLDRDLTASQWKAAEALASKLPTEATSALRFLIGFLTSPAQPATLPDWVPAAVINYAKRR
ncbi:MAG: hypothetical protein NXI12_03805 [Alphaproteobacteria bacterium]|nr:hypothetical protein [Alphaproteobacteria bacterium]